MHTLTEFLLNLRKPKQIFFIATVFLSSGLFYTTIRAQDTLRATVYGNTDKKPRPAPTSTKKFTKTTYQAPIKKKAAADSSTSDKKNKNNLLDVTFTAQEANAEIWLNDKRIGLTDETFKFSKKLAPGDYVVMAKDKVHVLFSMTKITVSPEQTNFEMFVKPPPPKPIEPKPVEPPAPKEEVKSDEEIAAEISAKVRAILENYANPLTTDSVTLDDWETVLKAAQLGQFQGYTAVQIEAQRWFASGQIELSKKAYPNALTAFNKAQEFMPSSALPFYEIGNTYLANNQTTDALKAYQRAVQLDPKLGMAYNKLGDVQRMTSKVKEAISAYKSAIQYGYQTPETHYQLAVMLLKNKQTEDAIHELEQVEREKPSVDVYLALGDGYERLKRDVSAIEYYNKAIKADPDSALANFKLGAVYFDQREYGKAKELLEKAVKLNADGKVIDVPDATKMIKESTAKLK